MNLTPAQLTTLKTFINADGTLGPQLAGANGPAVVAAALNQLASGPFIVWRTDISSKEVVSAIVGTEFVALTALKQNALMLLLMPGTVDASKPNIQADFSAIFSAGASLTALGALAKRSATLIEKVLATGTGSTGSPATMAVEGPIDFVQVDAARLA